MRPKITTCRHIARSVIYNEEKVGLKIAERLTAANLLRPLDQVTPAEIIRRFERRMQLNDRVRTSLHITLNFDPLDVLTNDRMSEIAGFYMKEIGFGQQPWIAWRHNDAGHPHCHIVTTHVQWNGDPIELYNIGRNQSEKARIKIEKEFYLVTKEMKMERRLAEHTGNEPRPLILTYGEKPLARAISEIVGYVSQTYHCTTMPEFNAALRRYHVEAYAGRPGTSLYEHRGLLYRALDEHGHYIGRPIKASFFDSKPTLENLEHRFRQNQSLKQENKEHVEIYAKWYLSDRPDNLEKVQRNLIQERIDMLIDKDRNGNILQVMYVDFRNKIVIPGDELHPVCRVEAIRELVERDKVRLADELRLDHTQRHRRGIRMHL